MTAFYVYGILNPQILNTAYDNMVIFVGSNPDLMTGILLSIFPCGLAVVFVLHNRRYTRRAREMEEYLVRRHEEAQRPSIQVLEEESPEEENMGNTLEDLDEVYKNQIGILNIDLYDYMHLAIIGAGSIGSFLALGLTKLGFNKMLLMDNDKVEKHNIPTQMYTKSMIGRTKVASLKAILDMVGYKKNYTKAFNNKVSDNDIIQADAIFVCTDSLESRKQILRSAVLSASGKTGKVPKLLIDGRMHGLVYRVFTVNLNDANDIKYYMKSLEGEGVQGNCTEKGIIHNIFGVVSTMIEQYRKSLVGEDYAQEISVDIRSGTVFKVGVKKWKKQSKPLKS